MSRSAIPHTPDGLLRFMRFAGVGAAFAGVYAALTSALVAGGLPVYATSVALYVICVPLAFLAQKRLTFGQTRARRAAFPIYAATQIACLAFVTAITTQFVTRVFWLDFGVYLISAGAAAVLSYAVCKKIVFSSPG